jgi:hypothetical protein
MNATQLWGIIRQILTFGGPMLVGFGLIPQGFWEIVFAWVIPIGASIVGIVNKENILEAAQSLGRHTATFIMGSLAYWGVMESDPGLTDAVITFMGSLGVILVSTLSKMKQPEPQ